MELAMEHKLQVTVRKDTGRKWAMESHACIIISLDKDGTCRYLKETGYGTDRYLKETGYGTDGYLKETGYGKHGNDLFIIRKNGTDRYEKA